MYLMQREVYGQENKEPDYTITDCHGSHVNGNNAGSLTGREAIW